MLHYLIEASFGNVDVAVAHLHVDPQAPHHGQAVLVVSQVLKERVRKNLEGHGGAERSRCVRSIAKTSQGALITLHEHAARFRRGVFLQHISVCGETLWTDSVGEKDEKMNLQYLMVKVFENTEI